MLLKVILNKASLHADAPSSTSGLGLPDSFRGMPLLAEIPALFAIRGSPREFQGIPGGTRLVMGHRDGPEDAFAADGSLRYRVGMVRAFGAVSLEAGSTLR